MKNFLQRLAELSRRQIIIWSLAGAAVVEAITVFFRFGLGLKAQKNTPWEEHLFFGLRIHHGYIGVILLILTLAFQQKKGWRNMFIISGVSLFLSDLIHHFLVLWPITGYHDFYLWY